MYNADSFHGPSIDRQEFFKKSTSSGISSIMISFAGRETCLPNHHFGPAIRAQYLLHFILKGKGRFSVNNKTYFLGENQAFLIQPNVAAYYAADSDDPWEYIWIGFDGADIQPILQNCGFLSKTPYISYPASDALIQNLSCIIEGMRDSSKNEYELLGSLFMVFGYLTRTQAEAISTSENSHLEKAVAFIKNNYYKSISVQTLSDYVGVDRTYLYRLFVRKFGISPKKYGASGRT